MGQGGKKRTREERNGPGEERNGQRRGRKGLEREGMCQRGEEGAREGRDQGE